MSIDYTILNQLASDYRLQLTEQILPFWESRTADPEYGGYLTQFDRHGELINDGKNMWCQGRQTYMFSALYRQLESKEHWLELGALGRDFIVENGYLGNGRWCYMLNRQGEITNDNRSIFTDIFVLAGLCEYAAASGHDDDIEIINTTYDVIEHNCNTPGFSEFHHHFVEMDPSILKHGLAMLIVGLAPTVRQILGPERVAPLVDQMFDRILNQFAKDEYQALFEILDANGNVLHTTEGLRTNPGHSLESAWMCMEEATYRNDEEALQRAVEFCDWAYRKGYDEQYGGLLAFVDPDGNRPPGPEVMNDWGERWDDKIWWVHCEALYALALTVANTQDPQIMDRLITLHEYTKQYFPIPNMGEWFDYLHRDGTPYDTDQAAWIKSAFHLPRSLLKLVVLLENISCVASES